MEFQVGSLDVVKVVADGVAKDCRLAATIVGAHDSIQAMTAQPEG